MVSSVTSRFRNGRERVNGFIVGCRCFSNRRGLSNWCSAESERKGTRSSRGGSFSGARRAGTFQGATTREARWRRILRHFFFEFSLIVSSIFFVSELIKFINFYYRLANDKNVLIRIRLNVFKVEELHLL